MRIPNDVKSCGAAAARRLHAVLKQRHSISSAPEAWLNKERVELRVAIVTRENGRKPDNGTSTFGYDDQTARELIGRYLDCVWVLK